LEGGWKWIEMGKNYLNVVKKESKMSKIGESG
jgi:hypothetical protein